MADFKTHLNIGILAGAGVAIAGFYTGSLTLAQAVAVFVVGSIAGLLPDLDSDTGKPLAFLFQLLSILIPGIFYFHVIRHVKNSPEFTICYFTLSFLIINYVIFTIIKKVTTHRGIMHSIPYALLCSGLGYLLFLSSGKTMAFFIFIAVLTGCLVHLILDEMKSITFILGVIPCIKKSSGTSFKFKSDSILITLFIYLLLFFVFGFIFLHLFQISPGTVFQTLKNPF